MTLITETVTINTKNYKHIYSDAGYYVKRNDDKLFMDVLEPTTSAYTYTETTQLATQQLIPRMMARMSTLETKHDTLEGLPHVIETYSDGTDWYRVYSDKWCIQSNSVTISAAGQVVTLTKPYKDTNYSIVTTGGTNKFGNVACYDKTTAGFSAWTADDTSFNAGILIYVCEGYIN